MYLVAISFLVCFWILFVKNSNYSFKERYFKIFLVIFGGVLSFHYYVNREILLPNFIAVKIIFLWINIYIFHRYFVLFCYSCGKTNFNLKFGNEYLCQSCYTKLDSPRRKEINEYIPAIALLLFCFLLPILFLIIKPEPHLQSELKTNLLIEAKEVFEDYNLHKMEVLPYKGSYKKFKYEITDSKELDTFKKSILSITKEQNKNHNGPIFEAKMILEISNNSSELISRTYLIRIGRESQDDLYIAKPGSQYSEITLHGCGQWFLKRFQDGLLSSHASSE